MAILLVVTIISATGANAAVHINDDEDDGSDDFEGAANWRRMRSVTLFPGSSTFCPGTFVVLFESIWFSFLVQAGSHF